MTALHMYPPANPSTDIGLFKQKMEDASTYPPTVQKCH